MEATAANPFAEQVAKERDEEAEKANDEVTKLFDKIINALVKNDSTQSITISDRLSDKAIDDLMFFNIQVIPSCCSGYVALAGGNNSWIIDFSKSTRFDDFIRSAKRIREEMIKTEVEQVLQSFVNRDDKRSCTWKYYSSLSRYTLVELKHKYNVYYDYVPATLRESAYYKLTFNDC